MSETPLLDMRGINKSFGAVQVLQNVDFHARAGEVTALVGDNGAGKSTLVKCIGGIYPIESGQYNYDGKPVTVHSPRDAGALGIEIVYQDLALCDNLDIVQNMFLGREKVNGIVLDEPTMEQLAQDTLKRLSVRTVKSVRQVVASLSGGQRQTVAIAKSVLWNSRLVVLDEPTAALGVAQTAQVLELVRQLADNGLAVVLISHNMNDVFAVADSISTLYLGRTAAQVKASDVTYAQVVELITAGRSGELGIQPATAATRCRHERSARMTAVETGAGSTAPVTESGGLGAHAKAYVDKLRGGDLGALPALSGLILLILIFGITQPDFFSKINIANLFQQGAAIIVIAMGLVFVLLLGDIDLSAGYAAGLCATIFTVLLTSHHVVWWVCVLTAIGVGIAIGLFNGIMVEKVGIPSFVVTLAMFLALQGLALYFLGGGRNISIFDKKMIALDNNSMPPWLGWVFFVLVGRWICRPAGLPQG